MSNPESMDAAQLSLMLNELRWNGRRLSTAS